MTLFYLSISIAILSNAFYHICQKAISSQINPLVSLIVTYLAAIVVSLCILPFYPQPVSLSECFKASIWPSVALGLAVVGLEMGFLLAYRAGWDISVAAVFSNVAVALFLVPLGLVFYKEQFTFVNFLGVLLCIGGLILIRR
ncbi:MAG: EamA family transporter [Acidobacteriota bacterium]